MTIEKGIDTLKSIAPAKVKDSSSSNRRVSHFTSQSKQLYAKPFKTFEEQCQLLEDRGLIIEDRSFALSVMKSVNYYRLEGYWYSFYDKEKDPHIFLPNTTFSTIYRQYCFDQELRTIVMDAIAPIEIALRTQFAYELGKAYGAFPFVKDNFSFNTESEWIDSYQHLLNDIKANSKESFVKHHLETYQQELLPIWAMVEIMSLGELSVWFDKRLSDKTKKKIAKTFNVSMTVFTSWLRCISLVRNICAHHARLWNRIMPFTLQLPEKAINDNYKNLFVEKDEYQSERRVFNSLIAIQCLLDSIECINEKGLFLKRVFNLTEKYRIDKKRMGLLHEDLYPLL